MKYKAVIFDLGGTLSCGTAMSEYANNARKIATICSTPIERI